MSNLDHQLIDAAMKGDLSGIEAALAAGANPNADNGRSIQLAATYGHLAAVRELVDAGADIFFALKRAAENGHAAVVEYLTGGGRYAGDQWSLSVALSLAATEGHLPVVKCLRANGADVHAEAMRRAVVNGHLPVVQCLLANGYDLSADAEPLCQAVAHGHLQIVQCLLAAGANIKTVGAVAMDMAGSRGFSAVLVHIIELGANRAQVLRNLHRYPMAVQTALLATGKVSRLNIAEYAKKGVAPEALCVLLERQGHAELSVMLRATRMLDPLSPTERAELIGGMLAKQPRPESHAHVGP